MTEAVPQVSVVLPTRNRRSLLPRAVRSVLDQEGVSLELLVIDDGSTDGTPEVLRKLAAQDPRIRMLNGPGRGAGAARNLGVAASRAPWIAFQDDDDEWLPGKLGAQHALAKQDPSLAVIYTDMEKRLPDGSARPYPAPDPPQGALVRGRDWSLLGLGLQSSIVRRTLLVEVGGFDESLPRFIDLDLFLRLVPMGRFVRIPYPYVLYHETPGISSSLAAGAAARERLLAKHAAGLSRRQRAWQEHAIGVLASSAGDLRKGRRHLWRAWRAAPWRPRTLATALAASSAATYRLARRAGGRP